MKVQAEVPTIDGHGALVGSNDVQLSLEVERREVTLTVPARFRQPVVDVERLAAEVLGLLSIANGGEGPVFVPPAIAGDVAQALRDAETTPASPRAETIAALVTVLDGAAAHAARAGA